MVPIPEMHPGDMVFWHPDIIHAVQPEHLGPEDSSVFYIPVSANMRNCHTAHHVFQISRALPLDSNLRGKFRANISIYHFSVQALPDCKVNREYVEKQAARFVAGMTPPDFPPNHSEKNFPDRGNVADLTPLGRCVTLPGMCFTERDATRHKRCVCCSLSHGCPSEIPVCCVVLRCVADTWQANARLDRTRCANARAGVVD